MNLFDNSKIEKIDLLVKSQLATAFKDTFNLISYSTTKNNTLELCYLYSEIKIAVEINDECKIVSLHVYNPSKNDMADDYIKFCSRLVNLKLLEYTEFQKLEAQTRMIIPLDAEDAVKNIGHTVVESTYIGPNEDISAIIRITK